MGIIGFIILLVALIACLIIVSKYVTPQIPAPWGGVVLAVCALIAILILLGAIGVIPGIKL